MTNGGQDTQGEYKVVDRTQAAAIPDPAHTLSRSRLVAGNDRLFGTDRTAATTIVATGRIIRGYEE